MYLYVLYSKKPLRSSTLRRVEKLDLVGTKEGQTFWVLYKIIKHFCVQAFFWQNRNYFVTIQKWITVKTWNVETWYHF